MAPTRSARRSERLRARSSTKPAADTDRPTSMDTLNHRHGRSNAIVLVLVILSAGCTVGQQPLGTRQQPVETQSQAPTASPVAEVPGALRFLWLGDRAFIAFSAEGELGYDEHNAWITSEIAADRLTLSTPPDDAACAAEDEGTYRWSVSPSGQLALEPVTDPCSERRNMLQGVFERSDCPNFPENFCLGDLGPGHHASTFFRPMVKPADWELVRGAMTYTVPEGWANTADWPDEYLIQPQGTTAETGIYLWSEVAIVADDQPCRPGPDPSIPRTPSDMAAWVVANPLLAASQPTEVTIGGLDGLMLDTSVLAEAELPCSGDGRPYAPMLVHAEGSGLQWGYPPTGHKRLYLLDLGDTRTLVISIEAEDPATFAEILPEATAIVESFEFRTE